MTAVATQNTPTSTPPSERVPAAGELRRIPLIELLESPWNPRKHFDPAKLAETAESLRTNGQLTPIIVRPTTMRLASTIRYEIGAGHRRFRAAPMAGLTSLLAVVRPLDDVAFLELLTIENKQREDVEPLDEAEGFKLLMQKAGYDVGKLAARIGLSKEYVYARLKLLQLVPEAKKYLQERVITPGHAILLARLSPSEQRKVIGNPTRGSTYGQLSGLFEGEDSESAGRQMNLALREGVKVRSVRELESYINDHIRQRPEEIDSFFFPETAKALAAAKEEALKVVHITHAFLAKDDVRSADKARVYGSASWKHAGGRKGKACDYAALGVVVSGPGRGDSLMVCVRRDKCTLHWPKPKRVRTESTSSPTRDYWAEQQARQERERARQQAEYKRWEQARAAILKAVVTKIKALPADGNGVLADVVLDACVRYGRKVNTAIPRGVTAGDLIRHAAFQLFANDVSQIATWNHDDGIKGLRPLGLKLEKIVDEVAPKPKAEKKPAMKKAKKK